MSAQTLSPYTQYEDQVRRLVEEHRQLKDEPLLLALCYEPDRNPGDVFLFEVIENFGAGEISPEQELYEVEFTPTVAFPMEAGHRLHLILTNPKEVTVAFNDQWLLAQEIRRAVKRGKYKLLFGDEAQLETIRG